MATVFRSRCLPAFLNWSLGLLLVYSFGQPMAHAGPQFCQALFSSDYEEIEGALALEEISKRTARIDLPFVHKGIEGLGIQVLEDRYAKEHPRTSRVRLLYAREIASCVAIVIHDLRTGEVMLSHVPLASYWYNRPGALKADVDHFQKILESSGSSFESSEVTLMWGPLGRVLWAPRLLEVVTAIQQYNPQRLSLDATETRQKTRGIYIDLTTGQVFKQNGSLNPLGDTGPIEQEPGPIKRTSWGTPWFPDPVK